MAAEFQILAQLPVTEITAVPSLPPPSSHRSSWPCGCCWLPADHITPLAMSQAAWIALGGSRLPSFLPPAPLPKEEWENAHLKLPVVTCVTGIKAVIHGGINPFQTCHPDGFHRSSISLKSIKKRNLFFVLTSSALERWNTVPATMFSYKFLMPFSKAERRWFQARRRLAERTSWGLLQPEFSLWSLGCEKCFRLYFCSLGKYRWILSSLVKSLLRNHICYFCDFDAEEE